MNLSLPVTLYDDWPLLGLRHAVGVLQPLAMPLTAAELLSILRERWGASYDLQLHRRAGRLYLQVMWAYLEQQSFPLSEADYLERLEQLVEQLNGIGQADDVRNWLQTTRDKPRLGKALSFPLPDQGRLSEFLL
tara:strand:+ start:238 stop:639 length:402 start_codon:yes stop_codon:yes gene_type:complete